MQTRCRHFNGYKPCGLSVRCDSSCASFRPWGSSVLLIHLGAMGAVLRSTALIPAILRKYPQAQLTWVTENPMPALLRSHPGIARVLTPDPQELLDLKGRVFDVALVVDKSARAAGILASTRAREVYGFVADERWGFSRPATSAAEELWRLGLSDHQKFFVNRKTENQLVHEALELGPYQRDPYEFFLTAEEKKAVEERARGWRRDPDQMILGLNTGCGPLMPAKKWTVNFHREVIAELARQGLRNMVLLGGPEDDERNQAIAQGLPVQPSATRAGIRDGAVSLAACDVVLSGDSFGMHLAIALKRQVIAWFGPSCAHEIDLYGRGEKLQARVDCSPCWKRNCDKPTMCYDQVPVSEVVAAVQRAFSGGGKRSAALDGIYEGLPPRVSLDL